MESLVLEKSTLRRWGNWWASLQMRTKRNILQPNSKGLFFTEIVLLASVGGDSLNILEWSGTEFLFYLLYLYQSEATEWVVSRVWIFVFPFISLYVSCQYNDIHLHLQSISDVKYYEPSRWWSRRSFGGGTQCNFLRKIWIVRTKGEFAGDRDVRAALALVLSSSYYTPWQCDMNTHRTIWLQPNVVREIWRYKHRSHHFRI